MNRVVLAYSGRAASAEISSLASVRDNEVVTLTLDLGTEGPLEAVRDRALAAGAARAHVLDVRDEYAREYLLPALRAGVLGFDGVRPRGALRRALTSRKLAEIAALERATPLEPVAESHPEQPDVAGSHAGAPALVDVSFIHGSPTALNGVSMSPADLFGNLSTIAGEHGLTPDPADIVLHAAHAELLRAALAPDLVALSGELSARYTELLKSGAWFTPMRTALDAFFAAAQLPASGTVRVKLFGPECAASGVSLDEPGAGS